MDEGYNKDDISKVLILVIREQGTTCSNGFKLDKFKLKNRGRSVEW